MTISQSLCTGGFPDRQSHEAFVGFGVKLHGHSDWKFSRSRNGCGATAGLAIAETTYLGDSELSSSEIKFTFKFIE